MTRRSLNKRQEQRLQARFYNLDHAKHDRSCLRKARYSTRRFAKSVSSVGFKKHGVKTYVYSCRNCHGFHLTRQPQQEGEQDAQGTAEQ